MNFLQKKTSWSNMELGMLKICVGSAYVIIGTCFHDFLKDYLFVFVVLFFITALPVGYLWLKRMKATE